MSDSAIRPAVEPPTVAPTVGDKSVPVTAPATTPAAVTPFQADSLGQPSADRAAVPATVFPAKTEQPKTTGKSDHPWHLQTLTARYTPMRVLYGKSDIHFDQPGNGTNLTIKDVQAQDRTSYEYLYTMPNGWPQLDEPQTSMGISGTFDNGWGFEANLKHNKYIVKDHSQNVQFDGTMNGEEVHGMRPLSDFVGQYEISGGMNQVSVLATKSLALPAFSPKDRFSLIVKGGPGALVTYTNSFLKGPSGQMEEGPHNYHLGGFSVMGETELRYDIRKRVSVSLTNSFSYCNVMSSQIASGGTAHHTVLASQVGLGVGYTFNFKDKPKAPVDPTH